MLVRRILPLLSILAVLVVSLPPMSAAGGTTAALPPERPYPAVLDAPIEYEGMTTCDPVARKGAMLLRQLLLDTYGEAVIGIARACDQDGISEHKQGRAVDWMVDWTDPEERAEAQEFVDWVTAPGPDGTPAANARRLGIMYIMWADEMWRAYDTERGWTEAKGCYSLQGAGSDTYCHRDHVHFSMTWDGAAARTSYWDDTPVVDVPCPIAEPGGRAQTLQSSAAFVPVKPVRVFDSRDKGEAGCYLQQRRWSSDDRSVPVRVTGRKGVPAEGVQAVAVRVTAYESNAPGWITASGSPGANGPNVVSLGVQGTSAGTAIVPVSDTGRIWLATAAGHARVAVDVLGYFTRTTSAAAGERTGTWSPATEAPVRVDLPARSSQNFALGSPPDKVTGAVLTINTAGSSEGHVRVTPAGTTTRADAVDVVAGTRSATVLAASADGNITLTNTAKAPTTVTVMLDGWITAPVAGGARLIPTPRDLGTFSLGKTLTVPGTFPAGARAVLLAVTTRGGSKAGGVTVWGAGPRPEVRSVDVRGGRSNTDVVLVPLNDRATIKLAATTRKATASLRLVGVVR